MISMLQPLIAGNAIRVFIEPITGAKYWRVLKKASDTFSGHDDQSAVLVYEGDEKVFQTKERAPLLLCIEAFRPEEL